MAERIPPSQSPENDGTLNLTRRQFLKFAVPAAVGGSLYAGYRYRHWLRETGKQVLSHFPELYRFAALLEEYSLGLLGMPVRVNLYQEVEATTSLSRPSESEIQLVANAQEAVDFFHRNPLLEVSQEGGFDRESGIHFTNFQLDRGITDNRYLRMVLGVDILTARGECLPSSSLALKTVFPEETRTVIAPPVLIPGQALENEATRNYQRGDYQALGLPERLISQTVISLGHLGNDLQPVPESERMIIQDNDLRGRRFEEGGVALGAVFLWADGSNWGLAEWPNPKLNRPNTSCASLIWNLNPRSGGQRRFSPFTNSFFSEQGAQLHGYVNHQVVGANYEEIGPTPVFRFDQLSEEKDIIFIPPFLPLVSPLMFQKIALEAPVGRNRSRTDPDSLLIALPDAKYGTMCGYHPAIFEQPDGQTRRLYEVPNINGPSTDFLQRNNGLALYLGF